MYKKQQEIAQLDALEQQARQVQEQAAAAQRQQPGSDQQQQQQQQSVEGIDGIGCSATGGAAPSAAPGTEQQAAVAAAAALEAARVAAERVKLEEQSLPLMLGALALRVQGAVRVLWEGLYMAGGAGGGCVIQQA